VSVISPLAGRGHQALGALPLSGFISRELAMTRPHEDRYDELFSGSNFSAEEVEYFRAVDRYKRRSERLISLSSASETAVSADGGPGSKTRSTHPTSSVVFRSAKEHPFAERKTTVTA
jgi:hypothetical protein